MWAEPVEKLQVKFRGLFWDVIFISFILDRVMITRKDEGTKTVSLGDVFLYAVLKEVKG